MVKVSYENSIKEKVEFPQDAVTNKRPLTENEIETLIKNRNSSEYEDWSNVLVDKDDFDPSLIRSSSFSGFVILGKLRKAKLKFHDLELEAGIYHSKLINTVTGDDNVIRNVTYLENYRIAQRVILFNIQEMSCTCHSKFGNGILKEGEPEDVRVWIGISNENDERKVLPFESMITADAYIWSRRRSDKELMARFIELTEKGNTKKLDTYGFVDSETVIKNTTLLKDTKIGKCAYIKGAFKLKNITIKSSEEEETQIGEGVELVNGIVGYGCRIFYQAVAVRFVLGNNCQLKYGARLLNSILGDNSTISCCELLNNLIFPFHEQHHNSSFLIATTIGGQSNIAAGATIGSNHNSRSPDGEIFAGRGFWPGLCSDFKHNSKFASFSLVSKGSYQNELNITYPFSLVANKNDNGAIQIMPAYWFVYNMFAIARNNYKFKKRDKRKTKVQNIETDPIAPDTMEEIITAIERIIELTASYLESNNYEPVINSTTKVQRRQNAKDYLHKNEDADFILYDPLCQKKHGAQILKPVKAYKTYRKVLKYFAARSIIDYCLSNNHSSLSVEVINEIKQIPLYTHWMNAGGQIVPSELIEQLCNDIKARKIDSWEEIHKVYDIISTEYENLKARYALYLFEYLYSRPIEECDKHIWDNILEDVTIVAEDMYTASIDSRQKDYTDPFRAMTYESQEEMTAILGTIDDNEFLHILKEQTALFKDRLLQIFKF